MFVIPNTTCGRKVDPRILKPYTVLLPRSISRDTLLGPVTQRRLERTNRYKVYTTVLINGPQTSCWTHWNGLLLRTFEHGPKRVGSGVLRGKGERLKRDIGKWYYLVSVPMFKYDLGYSGLFSTPTTTSGGLCLWLFNYVGLKRPFMVLIQ